MKNTSTHRPARARAGFTLIEIMVVIAIIGLLATFVAPNVLQRWREANVTGTKVKMKQLEQPIQAYRLHHGKVPDTLEDLLQPSEKNLDEPYVESADQLKDAWGNPFRYEKLNNKKFDIISLGADGVEGGEADDRDLHSSEDAMPGG